MKKVLTLGLIALFTGACVLSIYADDPKPILGEHVTNTKTMDYFRIKGADGDTALWVGTVAGMNGAWVHAPKDVKGNHGIGLIADAGGTRLVFGTTNGKGDHNRMGLGVGDNGKPYMWFVDPETGKMKHVDLSKLPELK